MKGRAIGGSLEGEKRGGMLYVGRDGHVGWMGWVAQDRSF